MSTRRRRERRYRSEVPMERDQSPPGTVLDRWREGRGSMQAMEMIRETISKWPQERMIKELLPMAAEFKQGRDREFALWGLSLCIHPFSDGMGPEVLDMFTEMRQYYHFLLSRSGWGLTTEEEKALWGCTDAAIKVSTDPDRWVLTLWLGGPTASELGGPTTSP